MSYNPFAIAVAVGCTVIAMSGATAKGAEMNASGQPAEIPLTIDVPVPSPSEVCTKECIQAGTGITWNAAVTASGSFMGNGGNVTVNAVGSKTKSFSSNSYSLYCSPGGATYLGEDAVYTCQVTYRFDGTVSATANAGYVFQSWNANAGFQTSVNRTQSVTESVIMTYGPFTKAKGTLLCHARKTAETSCDEMIQNGEGAAKARLLETLKGKYDGMAIFKRGARDPKPNYISYTPCFPGGVMIATPSGLSEIRNLRNGDTVIGWDIVTMRPVEARIIGSQKTSNMRIRNLSLSDGITKRSLQVTSNHNVFVMRDGKIQSVAVGSMKPGESVMLRPDGKSRLVPFKVIEIRDNPVAEDVYNIVISGAAGYFADGVLVESMPNTRDISMAK